MKIIWENRFMNNNGSISLITLDGTDFRTCKTMPFDRKWFLHKFKGPGLCYKVGICIQTGWIVWIHGPFPPGCWPDIKIAWESIHDELDPGEMYVANGGYCQGNIKYRGYATRP